MVDMQEHEARARQSVKQENKPQQHGPQVGPRRQRAPSAKPFRMGARSHETGGPPRPRNRGCHGLHPAGHFDHYAISQQPASTGRGDTHPVQSGTGLERSVPGKPTDGWSSHDTIGLHSVACSRNLLPVSRSSSVLQLRKTGIGFTLPGIRNSRNQRSSRANA